MEQNKIKKFTDLRVWQMAHEHVLLMYRLTALFPKDEIFSLVNQMRRAAVSITSNIAEGFGRTSRVEKLRYYNIAYASAFELQNQIYIARDLKYISLAQAKTAVEQNESVQRQLNALTHRVSNPTTGY